MGAVQMRNGSLTRLQKQCVRHLRITIETNKIGLLQLPTGFGKTRVTIKALLKRNRLSGQKLIVVRKKNFVDEICPWTKEFSKQKLEKHVILTSHHMFRKDSRVKELINFSTKSTKNPRKKIAIIFDESHKSLKLLKQLLKIKNNSKNVSLVLVSATPTNPVNTPYADDEIEAKSIEKSIDALLCLSDDIVRIPDDLDRLKAKEFFEFNHELVRRSCLKSFLQLYKFQKNTKFKGRNHHVKEMNFLAGTGEINKFKYKNEQTVNFLKKMGNEKVLIFCHYLKSAESLSAYLKKAFPGKVAYANDYADRNALTCFSANCKSEDCEYCENLQFLIVTDRHSESIDLHGQCNNLIHYELYWSPTVMAQRIGRLWRLGHKGFKHGQQQYPKFPNIYHLKVPHSIEMEIFVRLLKRLENIHKYNSFKYLDFGHLVGADLNDLEN